MLVADFWAGACGRGDGRRQSGERGGGLGEMEGVKNTVRFVRATLHTAAAMMLLPIVRDDEKYSQCSLAASYAMYCTLHAHS